MRLAVLCFMAFAELPRVSRAQAPVFDITPVEEGSIRFDVEASVSIKGAFDKPDATPIFASPDLSTAVLEIKTQAASVDTGRGMKNGKLKGQDFFDVERNPLITFRFTKMVQTGSEPLGWTATLRYPESADLKSQLLRFPATGQARARLEG